jgi:3-oxoacyl-[acyl-carrier-protein] synthase II
VPASIINMIAGHVSMRFGFKGPNLAVVTACTTGLHCIGEAGRMIEYGDADVVVAGGSEATVSPLGVGGFAAMRALSTRNDDPKTASRPWDRDRDGFVLGEGAGVLVLEELRACEGPRRAHLCRAGWFRHERGRRPHDGAQHGRPAARDGPGAAQRRRESDQDVDYLNAHGTSTPLGDLNEIQRHQGGARRACRATSSSIRPSR